MKKLGLTFLILSLVPFLLYWMKAEGLSGVSYGDFLSQGSILMPTIVANEEIKWVEPPKQKKPVKVTPKVEKVKETPKEVKIDTKCTSKVRLDLVNHAYKISGGDMKFLGTVASESMFDVGAKGDYIIVGYKEIKNEEGIKIKVPIKEPMSFGLCQIHKRYNPQGQKDYRNLKTDFEKLEHCWRMYDTWNKKGIVEKRLYGSLVWKKGLQKLEIKCQ